MVFVACGQGRIQGGRMKGMYGTLLPDIFENGFDISLYNFSEMGTVSLIVNNEANMLHYPLKG